MFYFSENVCDWNGFLHASEFWDDAEGAFVVASFGDFEIFKFVCCIGIGLNFFLRESEIWECFAGVSVDKICYRDVFSISS